MQHTQTKADRYDIENGPSKFDVMAATFMKEAPMLVFLLIHRISANIVLRSIAHEDGSYESWLIGGYVVEGEKWSRFEGYYSTRTRKGHMTIFRS